MAHAWTGLQSKCQSERDRMGSSDSLQWEHETLAGDRHPQVPQLLGQVHRLQPHLSPRMQHQPLTVAGLQEPKYWRGHAVSSYRSLHPYCVDPSFHFSLFTG